MNVLPANEERGLPPAAYIVYEDKESAKRAMESLGEEVDHDGTTGKLMFQLNRNYSRWTRSIFIGGIPHSTSEEVLEKHFEQFGDVIETKIITDEDGNSKGFGFIEYVERG